MMYEDILREQILNYYLNHFSGALSCDCFMHAILIYKVTKILFQQILIIIYHPFMLSFLIILYEFKMNDLL